MENADRQIAVWEALKRLKIEFSTWPGVADHLQIHNVHIYDYMSHDRLSPTLDRALVKRGYLEPKPTRVRFSGDTLKAAEIAAEARRRKLTNGEMIDDMWEAYKWRKML